MNTIEIIFSFIFIFIIITIIIIYYKITSNNINNDFQNMKTQIINTKLLDTNIDTKLLEANNKLLDANTKLLDANNKLSDTNNKLLETNTKLSETNTKFQNQIITSVPISIPVLNNTLSDQQTIQSVSVLNNSLQKQTVPIKQIVPIVPIVPIKQIQNNSQEQIVPIKQIVPILPIKQIVPIIPIKQIQNNSQEQTVPIKQIVPIIPIKQIQNNSQEQTVPIKQIVPIIPIKQIQNNSQEQQNTLVISSSQPSIISLSQSAIINLSQPAINNSSQPAIISSSQPAIISSSQPAINNSSQPAINNSSQPAIISSSQPAIISSSQPAIISSSQPAIISSSQPAIISSSQPAINNSSQPAINNSSQPAIISSSQEIINTNQEINNSELLLNTEVLNNINLRKEPKQYTNIIKMNEEFESIDKLESSNKKFKMLLKNSNIIIINNDNIEIFNTLNTNLDGVQMKINSEGSLIILSLSSKVVWSLDKKGIDKLILENDGAIRLYDNLNNLLWESQPLLVSFWQEFNSFKLIVEGQQDKKAYSNGTYTVSSSSYVSSREPYNVFNKSRIKYWNCSSTKNKLESNYFTYPYKNGLYVGGGLLEKTYKTNDISGEWIQIELPYNMILTNYSILNNQLSKNNFIKSWVIFGSNDNQTWETITSNILQEQIPSQTIGLYEINSTKDYCMFRLVITSLESGNEIQILQFNLTGIYIKQASSTGTNTNTNTNTGTGTNNNTIINTNNFLKIGDIFDNNSIIESNNKKFKLLLGQDKNLIITDTTNNQIWSSNVSSNILTSITNKFILLSNGNFSMVDKNNNEIWSTKTTDKGVKTLYLDNDGGLRLYDIINNVIWESKPRITPLKTAFSSNEIETSDGKYIVSASSSNPLKLPFNIFNIKGRNKYWDLENGFLYKDGAYIGTTKTTTSDSTNISGEWVQITLPKQLLLTNYALLDFVNIKINFIKSWVIVGTNDNTTWDIVDKKSISTTNQNDVVGLYNIVLTNLTKSYKTYRLIITSVDGGSTVQLVSFYLYGLWL